MVRSSSLPLAQPVDELAELRIEEGDLAVVEAGEEAHVARRVRDLRPAVEHLRQRIGIAAQRPWLTRAAQPQLFAERRRRVVGAVRVEVVQVEEEGLAQTLAHGERALGHARGVLPQAGLVEAREAAAEAAVRVEAGRVLAHDRARRHRRGGEAARAEQLGDRRDLLGDAERAVLLAEEARRVTRGEQRVDGRVGARSLRARVFEEVALGGQRIEAWARRPPVAVGAQVIGAQRVDEHDDDVPPPALDR